jgi:hypothetical protein
MSPKKQVDVTAVTSGAKMGIDLGGYGSAEVLSIDALNIDPDYQRDLRHDLINKIAREYDIVKAGPILVSEREDGSLWVVDGQHRMLGAKQAGETEVFANVVHGLTQEQEAELRLARNDRKPDSLQEKFRTRLVMGDAKAHAIVELVRQHDTDVNLIPSTHHGINGIATLEQLWDIDGKGTWLGRVLRTLHDSFGAEEMNPETCSVSMMKAVAWFLAQHVDSGESAYGEFVERLGALGPEDVRRKAVSHKAAQGGAMWLNYYRAIVELWNFRRQAKNQLRWKTIGSFAQLGTDSSGARGGYFRENQYARDRGSYGS